MLKLIHSLAAVTVLMWLFPVTVFAGLGFRFEQTINIPGLAGPITLEGFKDLDGDLLPEIYATDGRAIVVYSSRLDSLLLALPIDSDRFAIQQIELEDVNRDKRPDLVAGGIRLQGGRPDAYMVRVWDGASRFSKADSVVLATFRDVQEDCGGAWGNAQVVDLDHDGFGELLISTDSTPGYTVETNQGGIARLYDSFPTSMEWQVNEPVRTAVQIGLPEGGDVLVAQTQRCARLRESGGDTVTLIHEIKAIHRSGKVSALRQHFSRPCAPQHERTIAQSAQLALYRENSPYGPRTEMFILVDRTYQCGADTGNVRNLRTLECNLQASIDMTEYNWTQLLDAAYSNFAFVPAQENYFVAFETNRTGKEALAVFRASDGAMRSRQSEIPVGAKQWSYASVDSVLRLITVSGQSLTVHRLESTALSPEDGLNVLPVAFELSAPYTGQSGRQLTITVAVPSPGELTVDIYRIGGQRVGSVFTGPVSQGRLELQWDANSAGSGLYVARAEFNGQVAIARALVLW